ncbi:hypothetical protein SynBIOSE41_02837 [Synechococcus sp. BIOS-E4-1]|nr:hypothetical protein SynBIOSE41_02837 [Synechococcus sp. BIOS-E4-1]
MMNAGTTINLQVLNNNQPMLSKVAVIQHAPVLGKRLATMER